MYRTGNDIGYGTYLRYIVIGITCLEYRCRPFFSATMLFEVIVITSVGGKFSSDALEQGPYL